LKKTIHSICRRQSVIWDFSGAVWPVSWGLKVYFDQQSKFKRRKNMAGITNGSLRQDDESKYTAGLLYPLIFSVAFAIFVLGPPFLGYTFSPYPLMDIADVFDLLTPLVLLPLYWLLFHLSGSDWPSRRANITFMLFIGFWVLGQGMHLAANSIGHLLDNMHGTDIYKLTDFYDETLGHYLWHFGVIGLSALLIYRERKSAISALSGANWKNIVGGIIYGFVFFAMVNEGTTVPMGLSFAILAIIYILVSSRRNIRQPLTSLFLTGYSLALVLLAIWGIWHRGFPGFFEVGIVK
jgi:hypothetical protein